MALEAASPALEVTDPAASVRVETKVEPSETIVLTAFEADAAMVDTKVEPSEVMVLTMSEADEAMVDTKVEPSEVMVLTTPEAVALGVTVVNPVVVTVEPSVVMVEVYSAVVTGLVLALAEPAPPAAPVGVAIPVALVAPAETTEDS